MKLEPILLGVAQAVALTLVVASYPLAQKNDDLPRVTLKKSESLRAAPKGAAPKGAAPKSAALKGAAATRAVSNSEISGSAAKPGEAVARLQQVDGNVLVSQESGLASGDESLRLLEGSRVITTADSHAVVVYDDGCEVKLKPNQRLEVSDNRPCKERIVQAQSIFLEPGGVVLAASSVGAGGGVAAAALAGTGGAVGVAGAAGLAGLATLVSARQDATASPS